jgi:hypothetical protein
MHLTIALRDGGSKLSEQPSESKARPRASLSNNFGKLRAQAPSDGHGHDHPQHDPAFDILAGKLARIEPVRRVISLLKF